MQKDINNLVITRTTPLLILFMLDQSSSMGSIFENGKISKAQALSNAINQILFEIGLKSMNDGEIVSRFEIGIFAYGEGGVNAGWEGALRDKFIHTIKKIFLHPLQINADDTLRWIQPHYGGGTPMYSAFCNVKSMVNDWINYGNHRQQCHPPIVINVTDGEATDDSGSFPLIRNTVNEIKALHTDYGSTIILNIHISSENHDKVLFPNKPVGNDSYQQLLFEISSPLYPAIIEKARSLNYQVKSGARGYVYNGDISDLLHFLNIGTQAVSER